MNDKMAASGGGRKFFVPLWMSRRFLFSEFADPFLTFVSWISVLGVGLGVAALIVVTAVMNGFEGELKRVVSGVNGEILFYSRGEVIHEPKPIEEKMKSVAPEIRKMTRSFVAEAMFVGSLGAAGGILEGVDLETVGSVTVIPERIRSGKMPQGDREVVLGSAIAERIGAKEGEEITIVFPRIDSGTGEYRSKYLKATVVGVAHLGWHDYDSKFVFANLATVQNWMEQPGSITTIKAVLDPNADSRKISNRLGENFGFPYRARDWTQLNRNLLYAVQLEKVVISIILTAIIVVAAFNVVSTLMMMLLDKVREFSILKAMGSGSSVLFQIVSTLGLGIGAVGAFCGISLGCILAVILSRTHWIELPPEIYYIGFLPVELRWKEILGIGIIASIISWVASLYPAWKSAKISPMDGIRSEG